MNKYKTINGKIRHAHGPVGAKLNIDSNRVVYCGRVNTDVEHCTGCGYHVCSCPPKPKGDWVYNREMDMLVYEEDPFHRAAHEAHIAAHMSLFAKMSVAAELHSLGFVSPAEALDFLREDDSE